MRVLQQESQPSDLELVHAARRGDGSAFHALVDRHGAALFRLARSLSRTRADAEDICQETLAGAFQGLKHFDGRASVKTWLMRILTRRAAKAWHKSRHARLTLSIHGSGGTGDADRSEWSSGEPAVRSHAGAMDSKLDVMAVVATLSDEHREVIVLRELQGLSYEEIAAALDVPRGTVESRLHRARAELRRKLKGYSPESGSPGAERSAESS